MGMLVASLGFKLPILDRVQRRALALHSADPLLRDFFFFDVRPVLQRSLFFLSGKRFTHRPQDDL